MSAWETSLSPVTVSVEDDELDTSDFEEDGELEDKDEDKDKDVAEDDDEEEYEEFGAEAPREPHHDHPRRGDWNG